MTSIFMLIGYSLLVGSLVLMVRKGWILGITITAYTLLSMLVFDFSVAYNLQNSDFVVNYIHFTALPFTGIQNFVFEVRMTLLCLSLITVAAAIGGSAKAVSSSLNFGNELMTFGQKFSQSYGGLILTALVLLNLLNVFHFFSMDIDQLWHNSVYLTVKNAEDIGIKNPVMAIYHQVFRILVIPTILGYFLFDWRSSPVSKTLCLIYSSYGMVIMLAGSSRWAALYGVFTLLAMQAFKKITILNGVSVAAITFIVFEYALYSRSLNDFGLSQIGPNLASLNFDFMVKSIRGVFVNSFEAGINLANGLMIAPNYTIREQLISLSPLPHAIDGYDADDAILINIYAPMGGLGEFIFFHPVVQILVVVSFFGFLRLTYLADRYGNIFVRYSSAMAASYAIYILPSYSFRTSWKIIFLVSAALLVWYILRQVANRRPSRLAMN